jgi:phosphopantothenoylcysteine decarboxylase/phosphopantothenate--cysteine ligase
MHPAEEIKGEKSNKLLDKKIVVGVTGSIAAVETVKLCRELIRHSAKVYTVMTPNAAKIIHPDALEFATGKKPILELSGELEHIQLCGKVKEPADLLLIAPCTANTLSKVALGIDDTPVTTFATTAIGSGIPIIMVPAMHISMYENRTIMENIEKCKKIGIKFIHPRIEGNKAKFPNIEEIVANVIRAIGKNDLKDKKTLIIGGATVEPIDDVRVITNRSSGKTAISLAKSAFERGADIELWYGYGTAKIPEYLANVTKRFETTDDLIKLINKSNIKDFDIIILCAAISDYKPEKKLQGKIKSDKERLTINFVSIPKIVDIIKKKNKKCILVAFKLESNKKNIEKKTIELIKRSDADFVVANTPSSLEKEHHEIWIINKKGKTVLHKKDLKEKTADYILDVTSKI